MVLTGWNDGFIGVKNFLAKGATGFLSQTVRNFAAMAVGFSSNSAIDVLPIGVGQVESSDSTAGNGSKSDPCAFPVNGCS
jgi:hypothetical protein